MQCPSCGTQAERGASFCEQCGTQLPRVCEKCGAAVSASAKFCRACGSNLAEPPTAPISAAIGVLEPRSHSVSSLEPPNADAERRQLTVMFCDLVGSTQLSQYLDPEEYREVLGNYQSVSNIVIAKYEGHIAQYLGDGLLVYFGYPKAHEDDSQRAVRAALEIVEAVSSLPHVNGPLSVRVGIHTGVVVVGEVGTGGSSEQLALGDTPNIAARIQGLAHPNEVIVSAASEKLLGSLFQTTPLGPQILKGVEQPIQCHRVVQPISAETSLDSKGRLTPLVGRDQELGFMLDRWDRAVEGQGQVVMLMGEPGIGKSRLVRTLRERLNRADHRSIDIRCSPYFMHTPLYPFIETVPRMLYRSARNSFEQELQQVELCLTSLGIDPGEAVPLLALLLSRESPVNRPLPVMSPERQRRRTLDTLVELFVKLSCERPLLLVIEDLHWIDPTSLELLGQLIEQLPTSSVLLVLTARPEFQAPWGTRSYLTALTLNRLTRRQTEQVVMELARGAGLSQDVSQQIIERADGVPLFAEELTKTVLESELAQRPDVSYGVPQVSERIHHSGHAARFIDGASRSYGYRERGGAIGGHDR